MSAYAARWLLPLFSLGCEVIAGYGDVEPWPPEASTLDARADSVTSSFGGDAQVSLDDRFDTSHETADSGSDTSALSDVSAEPPARDAPEELRVEDAHETEERADSPSCSSTAIDFCSRMPRFSAPAQVLDGKADEFCGMPSQTFPVEGRPTIYYGSARSFPEVVTVRAGWGDDGFHAHVHVQDPMVVVATSGELYKGDAVEFYVAGSSMLTGSYEGTNDGGAIQVIISPPKGALPARATAFYNPAGAPQKVVSVDPSLFAARLVEDGYEVELRLPWSPFKSELRAGAGMGFDLVVDVLDQDPTPTGVAEIAAYFYEKKVDGTMTCGYSPAHLYCDDRTWCVPTLQ